MTEPESPRQKPGRDLFMGVLVVLVIVAAIILTAWAMRLHDRERALRGAAPPAAVAPQSEGVAGQQPPAPVPSQEEAVAAEAPPAPVTEIIPAAPGAEVDYLWIGGWWRWWEGQWIWHPGYWAHRPHAGAIWVPHAWTRGPRGWVHSGGRWR
jgi:hypothetical protein